MAAPEGCPAHWLCVCGECHNCAATAYEDDAAWREERAARDRIADEVGPI